MPLMKKACLEKLINSLSENTNLCKLGLSGTNLGHIANFDTDFIPFVMNNRNLTDLDLGWTGLDMKKQQSLW